MEDGGRDRDNGWRLFDSQNNNRGGNNRGTGQEYYYMGSTLPIAWVADQGCGAGEPNTLCTIVMQYSCNRWMRDGYETDEMPWARTIPYYSWEMEYYGQYCHPYYEKWMDMGGRWPRRNCSYDFRFGMQESHLMYETCRRTSRNKGLFLGTVKPSVDENGAIYTRQNPDGYRMGYECAEERDYYPYWRPSMWRDIAILTDTPERCAAYQAESENVKSRWVCEMPQKYHDYMAKNRYWTTGYVPITEEACLDPARRVPVEKPITDSKTGEVINIGRWVEVPAHNIPPPSCGPTPEYHRVNVLSNRDGAGHPFVYNWTIPDISYPDPIDLERCVFRIRYNVSAVELPGYGWADSTSVGPSIDWTKNAATELLPTTIPIWDKYNQTQPIEAFLEQAKAVGNVGNGYVFGDYPWVDIFGNLAPKKVYLQLAINTKNVGAVIQDRTHTFSFKPLPTALQGYNIYNMGVSGKRGNIVQTFPGTEYDFFPYRLELGQGDLIHIQWNGANTNPRGNAGEGPAGFDRSNIVVQRHTVYYEVGQELNTFNDIGHWGTSYPEYFTRTSGPRFLGLDYEDLYNLAIPPLNSGYFDLGLRQVRGTSACYHFLSTRNNNFTNRSQKGKVVVQPRNDTDIRPVSAETWAQVSRRDNIGWAYIHYSYDVRRSGQFPINLSDAGKHGGATHTVLVEPRYLSVPDGGMVLLKIEHDWKPFTYGRIYWTEHLGDEPQEVFSYVEKWSWNGRGTASAKIMLGGYYRVNNVVNGSAVGGVVIAILGMALISYFVVKRFGCRCWNKTDPATAAEASSQKESLLTPAPGPSSDSVAPAVVPSTTA